MADVETLARILFLDMPADMTVQISLANIDTSKQLFFLLLDLFLKGLVMLFSRPSPVGDPVHSICVHEITELQFERIAKCMAVAGIDCRRTITVDPEVKSASVNIENLKRFPEDLSLEKYRVEARTRGHVHHVWFRIVHNVKRWNETCGGVPAL
jgi:hypothetical protein